MQGLRVPAFSNYSVCYCILHILANIVGHPTGLDFTLQMSSAANLIMQKAIKKKVYWIEAFNGLVASFEECYFSII